MSNQILNYTSPEIIWIDKNVNDNENKAYLNEVNFSNTQQDINIHEFNNDNILNDIKTFIDIKSGINYLKKLKFVQVIVIISGSFFKDFIIKLKKNYKDIYVIPKIIIFTTEKRKKSLIKDFNYNEKNKNNFIWFGGIKTTFEEVKYFINSQQTENTNIHIPIINTEISTNVPESQEYYLFDQVEDEKDLILPAFYRVFIDMPKAKDNNNFILKICSDYKNDMQLYQLMNPIKYIQNIPFALLSKYYARIYTFNDNFYKDVKLNLLRDEQAKYFYYPYIKTLYEGVETGGLKTCNEMELYSAAQLSKEEIQDLMIYKQKRRPDLPMAIIFSKSFISFSKSKQEAENFYNGNKNAMLIVQKDKKRIFYLVTHADIEELSAFQKEEEVLFFPFSAFGIDNIEFDENMNRYNIKLIDLGKFVADFESKKNFKTSTEDIPKSKFKEVLAKSGLVEEERVNNLKIKEVAEEYKKYKERRMEKCSWKRIKFLIIILIHLVACIITLILLFKKKEKVELVCLGGYYYNSTSSNCISCKPGYYSEYGDNKCKKCPNGKSSYSNSSYCFLCPIGTFSNRNTESCTNCTRGYFSDKNGSDSCTLCRAGTFSNEGAHNCTECEAGYYSEKGSSYCERCPNGTISNVAGSPSCDQCPKGSYPNIDRTECLKCPMGSFSDDLGANGCTECFLGTYSDILGASSCKKCQKGTVADYRGATSCRKCMGKNEYASDDGTSCMKNGKSFILKYYLLFNFVLHCLLLF